MKKIKFCFLFCFLFAWCFYSIAWAKYEINQTYVAAKIQINQENAKVEMQYEQTQLENKVIETRKTEET